MAKDENRILDLLTTAMGEVNAAVKDANKIPLKEANNIRTRNALIALTTALTFTIKAVDVLNAELKKR